MSIIREQNGAALVMSLIVMSTLSLLIISAFEMLTLNIQIANNHRHEIQALYIADAGIEDAIYRLREDPKWSAGLDSVEFPAGSGNSYKVIIDNSGYPSILINSTGTVLDFHRSLETQIEIAGTSPPYSVAVTYWREKS